MDDYEDGKGTALPEEAEGAGEVPYVDSGLRQRLRRLHHAMADAIADAIEGRELEPARLLSRSGTTRSGVNGVAAFDMAFERALRGPRGRKPRRRS